MHPVNAPLTQHFGANPQFAWQLGYGHLGVDYGVPVGTSVVAIAPGTILWAGWGQNIPYAFAVENAFIPGSDMPGIVVVIQHDGWRSISAHLSDTRLNPGDRVDRGQEVGKSGNTGNSTGPHLHFEVYIVGNPSSPPFGRYNPISQIAEEDRFAGSSGAVPPPVAARPADHRRAGPAVVNQRSKPSSTASVVRQIQPKTVEAFTKWTRGEMVVIPGQAGVRQEFRSDVWFGDDAGWAWSGGFESQSTNGLPEHKDALPADHRKMGAAAANQRSAPNTSAAVVRTIPGGSVEKFTHWTRGEMVVVPGQAGVRPEFRSDIWYKDSTGYVWSGAFETQTTAGLPEFNPVAAAPVLKPNQRLVGAANVNQRAEPKTSAAVVRTAPAKTVETFSHWTKGESVTVGGLTSDLWYKDNLGYVWSGGFEVQSKDGLAEHVFNVGVIPSAYVVTKAVDVVTEVRPARTDKFELGNFPGLAVPSVYVHQFNADEVTDNPVTNKETVHIDSVINTFTSGERVASAHFAVEGTRVVQFLNLSDRAYAQGPGNGDGISIETYGGQDTVTMATVAKLIAALEKKKGGKFNILRHKDVMATKCGNGINVVTYRNMVDAINTPAPPVVVVPPVTVPPVAPGETAESVLSKVRDMVNNWFTRK